MAKKPTRPADPFLEAARRAEAARRRFVEQQAALEARMAEARRRMEDLRADRERRVAEIARRVAEQRGGKPPKRFRRPPEEGGEPVPAMPRPKPKPLEGGAAAPLDPDRRKPADADPRKRARRGRVSSDAESRQSL